MKKIVYEILKAEDHRELAKLVQTYINNGWKLHGGPFSASIHFLAFYQAVVMEVDEGSDFD